MGYSCGTPFYPEAEYPAARTAMKPGRGRKPHGPVAYRTPDGTEMIRGQHTDERAEGTWLMLSAPTGTVTTACEAFFEVATHKEAVAAARRHYGGLDLLDEATITEQRYRNGRLDGPARVYTLAGTETERAVFRRGKVVEHEYFPAEEPEPITPDPPAEVYPVDLNEPFVIREQMPAFASPECGPPPAWEDKAARQAYKACTEKAMLTYIYSQLRYSESARERGIVGQVVTGFVVEKDGEITGVKTLRGVSATLDAEARRVIASMPAWTPGWQRGQPVRVSFVLPINFGLE